MQKKGVKRLTTKKVFLPPEKGQKPQLTEALQTLAEMVVFSKNAIFGKCCQAYHSVQFSTPPPAIMAG